MDSNLLLLHITLVLLGAQGVFLELTENMWRLLVPFLHEFFETTSYIPHGSKHYQNQQINNYVIRTDSTYSVVIFDLLPWEV